MVCANVRSKKKKKYKREKKLVTVKSTKAKTVFQLEAFDI